MRTGDDGIGCEREIRNAIGKEVGKIQRFLSKHKVVGGKELPGENGGMGRATSHYLERVVGQVSHYLALGKAAWVIPAPGGIRVVVDVPLAGIQQRDTGIHVIRQRLKMQWLEAIRKKGVASLGAPRNAWSIPAMEAK